MENKPNILVIGDLMLDHYLWGDTKRISPEAPVQVIDIEKETILLGGAGNVVSNLKALDCNVTVLSVIGEDENGKHLISMLEQLDVKRFLICDENRKTTKKSRIIASAQQIVRYDSETKQDISVQIEAFLSTKLLEIVDQFDVIIVSDYGKGVITNSLMNKITFAALGNNLKVLVDPKGSEYSKYIGAYLLTPNKNEASQAIGMEITHENITEALKKLKNISALAIPMITLSEDGMAILDSNDNLIIKPTVAREVFDVTGAGDTVIASLGYSLAKGENIIKAIEFANLAAGVVVGKLGSATATLDEIEEYKSALHKSSIESHIKTFEEIEVIVEKAKRKNKRIVFTNGCFDILHKGHVQYLDKAKAFGDILIVGLNSDNSVKMLKGENRPINTQDDRAYILAALESVDYVVLFNENTPLNLIQIVKPDILVKGADYQDKEVVGSDIAKEVRLVQFVDGKSTTSTIQKIQECNL